MVQNYHIHREFHKHLNFHDKVLVTSFKLIRNLWMINEQFKCKGNIPKGQFESLKLIYCKFKGQFELQGQGQGHQFLK